MFNFVCLFVSSKVRVSYKPSVGGWFVYVCWQKLYQLLLLNMFAVYFQSGFY
jgi:hypothetical protein